MNTRQKRIRLTYLEQTLEHVQKRIAFHQERLVMVPAESQNQEIWEITELSQLKLYKDRERKIREEIELLQEQSQFEFTSVEEAHC